MAYAISQLEIKGFRGLRGLALRDLGRVNVLVGENNSGKTSVLEALALAAAPADAWEWMAVAARREPHRVAVRTTVERLRWLFPQHASTGPGSTYEGRIELGLVMHAQSRGIQARYEELRSAVEPAPRDTRTATEGDNSNEDDEVSSERVGAQVVVDVTSGAASETTAFTWWEGERFQGPRTGKAELAAEVITPYDHLFRALPARLYSQARRDGLTGSVSDLLSAIDPRIIGMEVLAMPTSSGP